MPAGADTRALSPSDVVNHMRAEDGLYVLGCFEQRVTLLSQQVRALNLVHSLRAEGLLDSGSAVAILGGGVAGLTAAAGAARLGCKVTLFEQGAALLHLIRGNHTRWLHPHLYDWPSDGAEREEAGLPLLDWRAALADDVVSQIEAGWNALPERNRIQVHAHTEVTDLGSEAPRRLTWNATSGFRTETFALVILAVGFGLERPIAGIPPRSYWDDDSLHQAARTETKRILISGTGDGGLIDLLRVRLRDFRHPEVLKTFLASPALGPVKERLLAIEREAVAQERRRAASSREHLYDAYMKLDVPEEVDEAIKARLRDDGTTVVLNGRDTLPLTLGASILNRFLVSRLLHRFGLAYRPGEFGEPKKKGDAFEVQFATGAPVLFDVIIGRHGPNPALERSFPAIWRQHAATLRARSLLDQTRWPIYGDTFDLAPPAGPPATGGSPHPTAPKKPAGPLLVGVPESLGAGFKGRAQLLKDVHRALQGELGVALHGPPSRPGHVAAHGGGGIGKSRLAAEYAVRHRDDYPGGSFFVVAADRGPLAVWAELARRAPHLFSEDLTQDEVAAVAFVRWLGDPSHGARLVVFDDIQAANAAELSARFAKREARGQAIWPIAPGTGVRVLFTTRLRRFPGAIQIEVAQLDAQAARELLVAKSERLRVSPEDEAAALDLADRVLGGHRRTEHHATPARAQLGVAIGDLRVVRGNLAGAMEVLQGAHSVYEQLARQNPEDLERQRNLSISNIKIGDALVAQGQTVDALSTYRAALAIAERLAEQDPGDAECKRDLSVSHNRIGDVLLAHGQTGDALSAYRATLPIAERLAVLAPGNAEWQHDLSVSHNKIGNVLLAQGQTLGALSAYRAALTIVERLVEPDPGNAEWQRCLSVCHDNVGDVLLAQGQTEDALSTYRAALAIAARLAEQDPANAQVQRDLSVSYNRVGNVLLAQGQTEDALSTYRAALAIAARLAGQDPANAQWQRDLSVSHGRMGNVLLEQGHTEDALSAYRAALAIAERLARQDPGNAEWQRDLSVSHNKVADVLLAQGRIEDALSAYRAALAISERLAANDPANAEWQRDLSRIQRRIGNMPGANGQGH